LKDVTFIRFGILGSDPPEGAWMGAFSRRYKLVFAVNGEPVLFDLEQDPNELTNLFSSPGHRNTVRQLARELASYAQTYHEPLLETPNVRSAVTWAAEGTDKYKPPTRTGAGKSTSP
jgi:hypothetical protein